MNSTTTADGQSAGGLAMSATSGWRIREHATAPTTSRFPSWRSGYALEDRLSRTGRSTEAIRRPAQQREYESWLRGNEVLPALEIMVDLVRRSMPPS